MECSSESDNGTRIIRSRKKHTNSHLGCLNCKKKKVKCDEGLPSCLNCSRAKKNCSYLNCEKRIVGTIKQAQIAKVMRDALISPNPLNQPIATRNGEPFGIESKKGPFCIPVYRMRATFLQQFRIERAAFISHIQPDQTNENGGINRIARYCEYATLTHLLFLSPFSDLISLSLITFCCNHYTESILPFQKLEASPLMSEIGKYKHRIHRAKFHSYGSLLAKTARFVAAFERLSPAQVDHLSDCNRLNLCFTVYQENDVHVFVSFLKGHGSILSKRLHAQRLNYTAQVAGSSIMRGFKHIQFPRLDNHYLQEIRSSLKHFRSQFLFDDDKLLVCDNLDNFLELAGKLMSGGKDATGFSKYNASTAYSILRFWLVILPPSLFNLDVHLYHVEDFHLVLSLFFLTVAECLSAVLPEAGYLLSLDFIAPLGCVHDFFIRDDFREYYHAVGNMQLKKTISYLSDIYSHLEKQRQRLYQSSSRVFEDCYPGCGNKEYWVNMLTHLRASSAEDATRSDHSESPSLCSETASDVSKGEASAHVTDADLDLISHLRDILLGYSR